MLQLGGKVQRTTTKKNAGTHAAYHEVFTFEYNSEPELLIYIRDDNGGRSDGIIASGSVNLTSGAFGNGGSWTGIVDCSPKKGLKGDPTVSVTVQMVRGIV